MIFFFAPAQLSCPSVERPWYVLQSQFQLCLTKLLVLRSWRTISSSRSTRTSRLRQSPTSLVLLTHFICLNLRNRTQLAAHFAKGGIIVVYGGSTVWKNCHLNWNTANSVYVGQLRSLCASSIFVFPASRHDLFAPCRLRRLSLIASRCIIPTRTLTANAQFQFCPNSHPRFLVSPTQFRTDNDGRSRRQLALVRRLAR